MEVNNSDLMSKKALLCVLCDQSFSTKEELSFHLECHNAIKPYFCTECDQRYAYKSIALCTL